MKIKRKTLTRIIRLAIRFFVVTCIASFLYLYFGTSVFTITSYTIEGVTEEEQKKLLVSLDEIAKTKLYKVFPNNKIFTYSSARIVEGVRIHIPDSASIDVRPTGLHRVKITVTRLKPLFKTADNKAVDKEGIMFTVPYDISMYPTLTIASSTETSTKMHGLMFTKVTVPYPHFLIALDELSSQISRVIFPVTSIMVDDSDDITLLDARGVSKVMISKEGDMKKIWSTLVSAIDTDPLKTKLREEVDSLLYLDVRYGNKVFYRFGKPEFQNTTATGILQDHETVPPATSTPTN